MHQMSISPQLKCPQQMHQLPLFEYTGYTSSVSSSLGNWIIFFSKFFFFFKCPVKMFDLNLNQLFWG